MVWKQIFLRRGIGTNVQGIYNNVYWKFEKKKRIRKTYTWYICYCGVLKSRFLIFAVLRKKVESHMQYTIIEKEMRNISKTEHNLSEDM